MKKNNFSSLYKEIRDLIEKPITRKMKKDWSKEFYFVIETFSLEDDGELTKIDYRFGDEENCFHDSLKFSSNDFEIQSILTYLEINCSSKFWSY